MGNNIKDTEMRRRKGKKEKTHYVVQTENRGKPVLADLGMKIIIKIN